MERYDLNSLLRRLLPFSLAIFLVSCGGGGGGGGNNAQPASGPNITEALTVNGTPAFKLSDGSVVLLTKLSDIQMYHNQFPPPAAPALRSAGRILTLPASVDLTSYQTPIKNQGSRGNCNDFAAIAAIEARYQHDLGLTLDLSEEWLSHIQKMEWLDNFDTVVDSNGDHRPKPPSQMEDQVGLWGGGNVVYNLELLSSGRIGVPEETVMPYYTFGNYGDTTQWVPPVTGTSDQRAADDINLSQSAVTYYMPFSYTTVIFPQDAQYTAKYQAGSVVYAQSSDLSTPNWVKTQLAAGHEVAFGVTLDSDGTVTNNIWKPGMTAEGGHAMLIVGYDDSKQAFRVKNSWGTGWADNGYVWFSYDWFTQGKVTDAASVQTVIPVNIAMPVQQLYLGRYYIDYDGWQGLLDVYHVPDSTIFKFVSGDPDNRIGTFYGPDGLGRRVNGVISGRTMDFYIDWYNTGARGYGELSGMHFTGYLSADDLNLSGTMLDNRDGQTYGFYGHKSNYLNDQATGIIDDFSAYIGSWTVYGQDISNSFRITAVDPNTGALTGTRFGGSALVGSVSTSNKRSISFQLQGQNYQGYIFGHEWGVISGTTGSGSATGGFTALRSDFSKPQVSIISPVDQAYRNVLFQLVGQAVGDTGSGFLANLPCNWTIDGSPLVSTACSQMYSFSANGSHSIQLSATAYGNATATTSINVSVVDPPTLPVINSISINGIVVIAAPNAAQQPDPDETILQAGTTLAMIGTASGQAEPLQYRWTWQGTDNTYTVQSGCPEIQIGTGGAPTWTPTYDTTSCVDYQYGLITLHVTDANNVTVSQPVHFRFVSPPT